MDQAEPITDEAKIQQLQCSVFKFTRSSQMFDPAIGTGGEVFHRVGKHGKTSLATAYSARH